MARSNLLTRRMGTEPVGRRMLATMMAAIMTVMFSNCIFNQCPELGRQRNGLISMSTLPVANVRNWVESDIAAQQHTAGLSTSGARRLP